MSTIDTITFSIIYILGSIGIENNHASLIYKNPDSKPTLYTTTSPLPTTEKLDPLREEDKYQALSRIMNSRRNLILLNTTEGTNITKILPIAKQFPRLELDRTDDRIPLQTPVTEGPQPTGVTRAFHVWKTMPLLNISESFGSNVEAGRYPVIYVNLGGISSGSYARIVEWIKDRIKSAFKDHRYLLKEFGAIMRDKVNNSRDEIFEAQRDFQLFFKIFRFVVTEEEVAYSLSYLSRILYNFFRQRVIIFIDQYDFIANNLTGKTNVISNFDKRRTITFLKHLLTVTTKLNIYSKKTVLIGSVKNTDENSFVEKYNIKEYYNYPNLYQFYSFPKPELDNLFAHFPKLEPAKSSPTEAWNDVYRERHKKDGDFYDALDIDAFMQVKFTTNVWADVFYIDFLIENALKSDLFRNMFIDVLWSKNITLGEPAAQMLDNIDMEFLQNHIFDEQNLENLTKHTADLIFVFLYKHGYLIVDNNVTFDSKTIHLQISKLAKIKTELSVMLMRYYRIHHGIIRRDFLDAIRNLGDFLNSDNDTSTSLKHSLEKIFHRFVSHRGSAITCRLTKDVTFLVSQIPLRYTDYEINRSIESDDPCCPEIILTSKERAILFNFEVGTVPNYVSQVVLKELKQCQDLIRRLAKKHLRVKLIGINISPNANIDIYAEFANSK